MFQTPMQSRKLAVAVPNINVERVIAKAPTTDRTSEIVANRLRERGLNILIDFNNIIITENPSSSSLL